MASLFNNKNTKNTTQTTSGNSTLNQLTPQFQYGQITEIMFENDYRNGNIRWLPYSPSKGGMTNEILLQQKKDISVGEKATPFFNFFQYFPTINEIVLIINNPKGLSDTPYFYFPPMGMSKNTYIPEASLNDINNEGDIDLGGKLKESNLAKFKPTHIEPGSTKIENRSGASFHLGSFDMGKSPFIKLTNGQGDIDPNLTMAVEDINLNCCSIYMTTEQKVPIKCSSLNFESFDISDDEIAQYNKDIDEMAKELGEEREKEQYKGLPETATDTTTTPTAIDTTTEEAITEELHTQTNETPTPTDEKETPVVGGVGQSTFEVIKRGSLIITIPKDPEGNIFTQEASIIWGGTKGATPEFMLNNIQESTKKRKILIISPHNKKIDSIKDYISREVGELGDLDYNSLCGFSTGGVKLWEASSDFGSVGFIGMIDPSTNMSNVQTYEGLSADIKKNIKCMTRPDNWGGAYGYIGEALQKLLDVAKSEGNESIVQKVPSKSYNQEQIPSKFFLKYKDLI